MSTIRFAKDQKALLAGADHLVVVAAAKALGGGGAKRCLPDGPHALVKQLATGLAPGDRGATATSLSDLSNNTGPARVTVGALPDTVSRWNSAARPEAVENVVGTAGAGKTDKGAVLLVLDRPEHATPVLVALARAYPLYSAKSGKEKPGRVSVLCVDKQGAPVRIAKTVRTTVEAVRQAARLVDTPPTEMHPGAVVREAKKLLGGVKSVRTKVISGDALLAAKLGGLHAVGRTAVVPPRLFVATYSPPGAKGPSVALIGKGVTYDTGGLSLKVGGSMAHMKCDMGGAAAVLGAFEVLVKSGIKRKLHLLLALAENAIGPTAYKLDDVLRMHSGKTVEVNNTDAEGRIVLADALSWAARVLKADVAIDAATLTGAQLVATGMSHAAVISNDADVERALVSAGHASGDLVCPLPFAPELFRREFTSAVADMKNSVKNRMNAQCSCAAQFLHNHIDGTPLRWCHVDLAGPAFKSERGTGFGVALIAEAVREL